MTVQPSLPPKTNRGALAARLTELRTAAGLSGNAFARRIGIVQSRVWKIEHAALTPTEDDVQAWVKAAGGSEDTLAEVLAMLASARAEQAYSQLFRKKGGAADYQDRVRGIEERSARIGEFQVGVIPGILQTADYARELVSLPAGLQAWGTDDAGVEDTIAGRLRRQEILHDQGKRVQVVLTEGALRTLVVSPEALAGQLGKLLSVVRLPSVELGVIGFGQRVPAYTIAGFRVYDDDLIIAESIAGERYYATDTEPDEVKAYLEAFSALRQAASGGSEAEAIIQQALEDIRR